MITITIGSILSPTQVSVNEGTTVADVMRSHTNAFPSDQQGVELRLDGRILSPAEHGTPLSHNQTLVWTRQTKGNNMTVTIGSILSPVQVSVTDGATVADIIRNNSNSFPSDQSGVEIRLDGRIITPAEFGTLRLSHNQTLVWTRQTKGNR